MKEFKLKFTIEYEPLKIGHGPEILEDLYPYRLFMKNEFLGCFKTENEAKVYAKAFTNAMGSRKSIPYEVIVGE